jgi:hypothetical protein
MEYIWFSVAYQTITAMRNAPAIARRTLDVLSKLEGVGGIFSARDTIVISLTV